MGRVTSGKKYIFAVTVVIMVLLIFTIPSNVDAELNKTVMMPTTKSVGDEVQNYELRVIEDEELPMAPKPDDTVGKSMAAVVYASLAMGLIFTYFTWFMSHRMRIEALKNKILYEDEGFYSDCDVSVFHPIKTIRYENELENRVVFK